MATDSPKKISTNPPPVRPWYKQKTTWNGIGLFLIGLTLVLSGKWELGGIAIGLGLGSVTGRQATAKVEAMLKQLAPLLLISVVLLLPACTAAQKRVVGEAATAGGEVATVIGQVLPPPLGQIATIAGVALMGVGNVLADRSQQKEKQPDDAS